MTWVPADPQLRRNPDGCAAWESAWLAVMDDLADGWNIGAVTAEEVYAELTARTGMTEREVARHAHECCARIELHPTAWRVANEHRLPQALVTVNPDLFVEHVTPMLQRFGPTPVPTSP